MSRNHLVYNLLVGHILSLDQSFYSHGLVVIQAFWESKGLNFSIGSWLQYLMLCFLFRAHRKDGTFFTTLAQGVVLTS